MLVFKIVYEAKSYYEKHKDDANRDWGKVLLSFVYENKALFRIMYRNGLITAIMKAFDELSEWKNDRQYAYVRAFFVYGFFGVIYQWIKYDFDETPEQIQQHTANLAAQVAKEKV